MSARNLPILFAAALVFTGCGNYRYTSSSANSGTQATVDTVPVGPTVMPSIVPSLSSAVTGTQALYSYRVGSVGYTSTSVTVPSRTVLRVRFTPGTQDENIAGSGYSAQYSGLGVYIGAGSMTKPTSFLHNGYASTAVESYVIDLSGGIQTTCPNGDTTCRQIMTITVSRPNYDWYCLNGYSFGCPWAHVSDTHPWHGTLEVQTDDTIAIQ